jgi:hypothetical protein
MAECPKCKELQERVWRLEEALEQYDSALSGCADGLMSKLDDLRGDFPLL